MRARSWQIALAAVLAGACDGGSSPIDAAPRDGGPEPDGSVGIVCRLDECPPGDICCDEIVEPPRPSGFCLGPDVADGCGGTTYACDGPEDCPTDAGPGVCCAGLDDVACAPPGGGCAGSIVCHDNDDCPGGGICGRTSGAVVEACI